MAKNSLLKISFLVTFILTKFAHGYWLQYGGKAYFFSHHDDDQRNYADSAYVCQYGRDNSRLVSINSEDKNIFLIQNGDSAYFWTGLSCTRGPCAVSQLTWLDGTRATFSPGLTSMPDDTGVSLYGTSSQYSYDTVWTARNLDDDRSWYICEKDDPCLARRCLNGGRCVFSAATGYRTCVCPSQTVGSNCACDSSLCQHDTQCMNTHMMLSP